MSWQAPALNWYLRHTEKRRLHNAVSPDALRVGLEWNARLFFHAPWGTRRAWVTFGPGDALRVTAGGSSAATLMYIHGGAFVFGSPNTHAALVAALAKRSGIEAVLPRYPLAPEHPYPAALDHLTAFYRALCAEDASAPLILGGDSAGAALMFALLARVLSDGLPPPVAVFAFSPLTDLTFSGESFDRNAEADVLLPVSRARELSDMYLGAASRALPEVSPLFATFEDAPPVWMSVGDTEVLYHDAVRMAAHLKSQGVPVSLHVGCDLPHVWPIFHNVLPEARSTLDTLSGWIKDQTGTSAAVR